MNHDIDGVIWQPEEVVRLDHLQGLVRERGTVDGDLRSHLPGRVLQRLIHGRTSKSIRRPLAKGATRRSEDEPSKFPPPPIAP